MDPEPEASGLLERLRWDSDHFGLSVARVRDPQSPARVRAAADLADRSQVRCLVALIDAADTASVAAAEEAGYRCRDIRVEMERPLRDVPRREPGVREATEADLPGLKSLARERFVASRYFADPNFERERVRDLYAAWLERGFATDSRRVLVPADAEAFMVCHLDDDGAAGTMELLAVAAHSERRGVGGRLLRASEACFSDAGLPLARFVTQGRNLPLQRLYQGHGYKTCAVGLWMHRWGPGSDAR